MADLARCLFFFYCYDLFYYLFIFCLSNLPKLSFMTVAFPNKSIINHKSVSLDWQKGSASCLFLASYLRYSNFVFINLVEY